MTRGNLGAVPAYGEEAQAVRAADREGRQFTRESRESELSV